MIVNTANSNTLLSAASLAVSVMALLITVMGALAAVVTAAFVIGLLVGAFIIHYVGGDRET
jgi:hypothetical protein